MKKWYQWFYLSLAFAVGGILNYLDGKQIVAAIIQVSITVIFAFIQFFCDKKGGNGKKVFKYISMGTSVLLIIILVLYLLFSILI